MVGRGLRVRGPRADAGNRSQSQRFYVDCWRTAWRQALSRGAPVLHEPGEAMSETRIDLLRDEITRIRADVLEASMDCYAYANLTFPAPAVTAAWINMAKRLRAIVEKTK